MEPVKLWRFALFYGGVRLVLIVAFIAASVAFPILEKSGSGLAVGVEIGAIFLTHYRFVQKTGREIEVFEYWPLVFRCLAVSMVIQTPVLLLVLGSEPAGFLAFAFALGAVLSLVMLMIGFRSSVGRQFLKGLEQRRQRQG